MVPFFSKRNLSQERKEKNYEYQIFFVTCTLERSKN